MTDHTIILNAAKSCYLRLGVAKTTAADVAQEAGISRATLYRRFPSHNDIFLAVLARDSLEIAEDCRVRLEDISDPVEHMVEGILFTLDEIVRRPLHAHLFSDTQQTWALAQVLGTSTIRDLSVNMMLAVPGANRSSSEAPRDQLAYLGEWIIRILVSYATAPSQLARNRDEMRTLLHTTLAPTVRAIFGDTAEHDEKKVTPIR